MKRRRSFSKDPVEGSLESESIKRSPIEKQAKNNQVGCDSNEDSGLDVDMSEVTSREKGKSSSSSQDNENDDESTTAAEIPSKLVFLLVFVFALTHTEQNLDWNVLVSQNRTLMINLY